MATVSRRMLSAIVLIAMVCVAGESAAGEPDIPDTGWLTDKVYSPALDALCGGGRDISKGCSAVRAREIVDASVYPWSAVGRINFASIQIRSHCTGTLIGERLVITAAHCLYNYFRKGWIPAQSIAFVAGYQRGAQVSYSKAVRYILDDINDAGSRHFKGGPETDWALIELESPIGVSAGYLGVTTFDQAGLDRALAWGAKIALSGYPQVREHVQSLATDCGAAKIPPNTSLIVHRCTAMRGDSGAPILLIEDGKTTVIGVMSGYVGRKGDFFGVAPSAVTFRDAVLDMLRSDTAARVPGSNEVTAGAPPAR